MSSNWIAPEAPYDIRAQEAGALAMNELMRAKTLFPEEARNAHEMYAILLEEVDELWDVVKTNAKKNPQRSADMRKEAIQVAAMALRFIVEVQ